MTDQQKQPLIIHLVILARSGGSQHQPPLISHLWLASSCFPSFHIQSYVAMFRLNCLFTQALEDSRRKIARDYSGNMARYKLHLNCLHPLLILYNIIMSACDNFCPCVLINHWLEHSLSHLRVISCAKLVCRWQFTKTQSMSSFYSAYQVSS